MIANTIKSFLCLIFFLSCFFQVTSQISICTWNIENFGKTKSDAEIEFIAKTLKNYDIVAIQEVVAGEGGAEAVARLHDALNRTGASWDYTLSDPTYSSAYKTERYAYFWKKSKVSKKGDAWLEKKFRLEMDREPYLATFSISSKEFTLVNFHAITKTRQPETEVKYLKFFESEYQGLKLIFVGDFNLPQTHTVFNPLKSQGYKPLLINQKTSLRQECIQSDCLASEFDNIFLKVADFSIIHAGVVHFYKSFSKLEEARRISDHIPVFAEIEMKY